MKFTLGGLLVNTICATRKKQVTTALSSIAFAIFSCFINKMPLKFPHLFGTYNMGRIFTIIKNICYKYHVMSFFRPVGPYA